MRYYDGRFLIYDSETKFKASELTLETLELIGSTEGVRLRYHEATGLVLPYILTKFRTDTKNSHNLLRWFENMINNSDKKDLASKGLAERLTKLNISFTQEDIDILVNVPLELVAQRTSPVSEGLLAYVYGDWQATVTLRRRIMVDDVSYKHPNKTLNQNTNTDELGVRLPDAEIIVSHIIGEPYADTPFQGTYRPYPNRLYRMKQIVAILTSSTSAIRLDHINRTISMLTDTYNIKIPPIEIRQLRSAFKILPLEHVIGNSDNDTVEIYDNEHAYYENLVDFIKYHIIKFNKEIMINSSAAEIAAKSEQDYNTGVLPLRLSEYLEQLLYDVLYSNFYHTGNFNYIVKYPEVSPYKDNIGLIIDKDDIHQSDLHIIASNYLGLSAKTFSASVWAEGIIKLMRWGDRKVKNLNVGLNNTQYLDLQTMNLITHQPKTTIQDQEERKEFMYPIYEGPEITYNKITRRPNDDTIIGGYADSQGFRIFASVEEITSFAVDGAHTHAGGVLLNLFQTLLSADTGNSYVSRTKVISEKTIHTIYKALEGK